MSGSKILDLQGCEVVRLDIKHYRVGEQPTCQLSISGAETSSYRLGGESDVLTLGWVKSHRPRPGEIVRQPEKPS